MQYKDSELFSHWGWGFFTATDVVMPWMQEIRNVDGIFPSIGFTPFVSCSLSVCQMLTGSNQSLSPTHIVGLSSHSLAIISFSLVIAGEKVEQVGSFRYLGVNLSRDLTLVVNTSGEERLAEALLPAVP